jgi:superfamily II DNA/RNA helicase
MSFTHFKLHANILKAINDSGYTTPSPIQAKAIPVILAGKDLIASAQTGTGKTAAFVLPTLQYLLDNPSTHGKPQVLVLSPTRELAQQIEASAKQYGKHMRFTAASIVGGMPYRQQFRQLSRPLDMIIATPGRFMDIMERPDSLDLSQIKVFILDEADRMLDMGFIDDVAHIAKHLEKVSRGAARQTLLFSATIDSRIAKLAKNLLDNPEIVEVTPLKAGHTQIEQRLYIANDTAHKNKLLDHILESESIHQGIIFSGTKRHADSFAKHLRDHGHEAVAMHGDMKQTQRIRTIEQLRNGKIQFLVATDVAARGIDVRGISHVINYDLPRTGEDYTHRIGRTGRAGNTGIAITFALSSEGRTIQQIERTLGMSLPQCTVPGLEPRAGFRHGGGSPSSQGGKKKFGAGNNKSKYGQGRGSDSRSTDRNSQSRFGKPDFAKKRPGSDSQPFNRDRNTDGNSSRFAKPDYAKPAFGGKPDYAKKRPGSDSQPFSRDRDRAPSGNSRFAKPDYAKPAFGGKPDYAKKRPGSDAQPFNRDRNADGNSSRFAKPDYAKPAFGGKPDYAKKRPGSDSQPFSRDRNANGNSSRFAKPDYAKPAFGEKPDYAKKRRDSDSRPSFDRSNKADSYAPQVPSYNTKTEYVKKKRFDVDPTSSKAKPSAEKPAQFEKLSIAKKKTTEKKPVAIKKTAAVKSAAVEKPKKAPAKAITKTSAKVSAEVKKPRAIKAKPAAEKTVAVKKKPAEKKVTVKKAAVTKSKTAVAKPKRKKAAE